MSDAIKSIVKQFGASALATQNKAKLPIDDVMNAITHTKLYSGDIARCQSLIASAMVRLQSIIPVVINAIDHSTANLMPDPNMSRFLTYVNKQLATLDQGKLRQVQTKFCKEVLEFPNRVLGYEGYMVTREERHLKNVVTSYSAMYIDLLDVFAMFNPYPIHSKQYKLAFNECVKTAIDELVQMDQEDLYKSYFDILESSTSGTMEVPIDALVDASRTFAEVNVTGVDMGNFAFHE